MSGPRCSTRITHLGVDFPLLSWTSAMQCWSFSLPAGKEGSCPMEDKSPNSICSFCYAQTGYYCYDIVRQTQWRRFLWLRWGLRELGPAAVASVFIHAIRKEASKKKLTYFRIHDSGDFFSVPYIIMWGRVIDALPNVLFMIPTRAWTLPKLDEALRSSLGQLNAVLIPSARHFNDLPPDLPGYDRGSSAITPDQLTRGPEQKTWKGYWICPKSRHHTSCETEKCRRCWHLTRGDRRGPRGVVYVQHAYPITPKIKKKRILTAKTTMETPA